MANGAAALGLIPSLLGLGASIGTAIPGLRKPKRTGASRKAAQEAASRTAAAAVGGAQTGFGATRGLALRTGLRQASEASRAAAPAAAEAALRDEALFQEQQLRRNQRLAEFGQNLAGFGATLGEQVVEARAAKAEEERTPEEIAAAMETSPTARQIGGAGNVSMPSIQELAQQQQQQPQLAGGPTQEVPGVPQAPETQLAQPDLSVDPIRQSLGLPQLNETLQLAPQAEFKLRMQSLAFQEAERQGVDIGRVLAQMNRMTGNIPQLQPPGDLGFEDEF